MGGPDQAGRPEWSTDRFQQQCTAMNVVVCVKQIPDPAAPGALDPGTNTLDRAGKLIMDDSDTYGVEMALQLADRPGAARSPSSPWLPAARPRACAPPWPWARPRPSSISDDALAGTDALGHGQGAGRGHQAGRARPGRRGHRVDRRLHRHHAGPGGRAAGPALGDLRQGDRRSTATRSRSSARPRPATTRSSARCPPWSRSPPAWSSPATPRSRGSWRPSPSRSTT